MGIEPARVVRLRCNDGEARFFQLGRALTTAAGVEDIAPVQFGEPGTPAVLGSVTLSILMLELQGGELVPVAGRG